MISAGWKSSANPDHINKLELRSALSALRWRARKPSRLRTRFFHFMDSQVALGVVSKARSASLDLQMVSDKINATVLSAHLRPVYGYVHTKVNPADAPSRQRLWRGTPRSSRVKASGVIKDSARRVPNSQKAP